MSYVANISLPKQSSISISKLFAPIFIASKSIFLFASSNSNLSLYFSNSLIASVYEILSNSEFTILSNLFNKPGSINLSKNEVSSFNNNGYLFENLDGSFWGYENGKFKTKISDIRGYWTLSSNGGSHDDAWSIYDDGNVEGCIVDNDDLLGVRPVINLKL